MQPRLQAVATRDANVCVPKVNRSSPPKITFSHPNFHVHRSTWQSHPDGHSGLKRPPEDLFKRIRREKNHPKWMHFLHKTGLMCNDFLWMEERNRRMERVILLIYGVFWQQCDILPYPHLPCGISPQNSPFTVMLHECLPTTFPCQMHILHTRNLGLKPKILYLCKNY